mmetsp:Transcript_58485/g.107947  ORF Transcript_58485/g.107947 Transcript_58485/m.107947 type:complete len:204 (+) Transcript_58485:148-759(+)
MLPVAERILPWNVHLHGFNTCEVQTEVRKSNIPDAGWGRFITQPCQHGTIIACLRLVSVDEFLAMCPPGSTCLDKVLVDCKSENDMDKVADHFLAYGDEQDLLPKLCSFFAGYAPHKCDDRRGRVILQAASFHANHSDVPNAAVCIKEGFSLIVATRDITAGEELFLDYKQLALPPGFQQWFTKRKQVDVATAAASWEPKEAR